MVFLEILLIILSIYNLIYLVSNHKKLHCIYAIIAIFDIVFVLPLLLEMIYGIPNVPRDIYGNYIKALEDEMTLLVYCSFIAFAQSIFLIELRKIKRRTRNIVKVDDVRYYLDLLSGSKYKNMVLIICYSIVGITIFSVLFSPDPTYFLKLHSVMDIMSQNIHDYKYGVINPISELMVFAIIIIKLFDNKNGFLRGAIRLVLIVFYTVLNGKRTYLMIIVGTYFLIDAFRAEKIKKIIPKYAVLFSCVAVYFVAYAYITEKISYNSDWYYEINEYIFRSMHMRFAIYAVLHPNEIHILDYAGQAFLSDVFFFVPRSLWVNKPYPYLDYYMMGLMNITKSQVTYHMPMSYYPEFVSNFGLLGIPISILFSASICRYFDKRNPLCRLLGIALISLLNIYYYNDLLKIVACVLLLMCIRDKYKIRIGRFRL